MSAKKRHCFAVHFKKNNIFFWDPYDIYLKVKHIGGDCAWQEPEVIGDFFKIPVSSGCTLITEWRFVDENDYPIALEMFYMSVFDFDGEENHQQLIARDTLSYRLNANTKVKCKQIIFFFSLKMHCIQDNFTLKDVGRV